MVDFIGGSIQFIVKYLPQIILMILIPCINNGIYGST